ncbi:unnamed protein product, partial [Prorocentrum cordatum]
MAGAGLGDDAAHGPALSAEALGQEVLAPTGLGSGAVAALGPALPPEALLEAHWGEEPLAPMAGAGLGGAAALGPALPADAYWSEELLAPAPGRQAADGVLEECGRCSGSLRRDLESTVAAALSSRIRLGSALGSELHVPWPAMATRAAVQGARTAPAPDYTAATECSSDADPAPFGRQLTSECSTAAGQAAFGQQLTSECSPAADRAAFGRQLTSECSTAAGQAAFGRQLTSGSVASFALSESGAGWQAFSRRPDLTPPPADTQRNGVLEEAPRDPQEADGISGLGGLTTAMVRNLPAKLTQRKLVSVINGSGLLGQYDYVYVPMDSRRHTNRGVGFVNFTTPEAAARFYQTFNNMLLPSGAAGGGDHEPQAPLAVVPADMQGFEANAAHHFSVRRPKNAGAQPLFLRALPAHVAGAAAEELPPQPPRER